MTKIKVKGMTCQHCVMSVTKALSVIEGVTNVIVDIKKGEAVFQENKPVDMNVVKKGIEEAGYEVG